MHSNCNISSVSELLGKTLTILKKSEEGLYFETLEGGKYLMFHMQDCCESVTIDDIEGDLKDLVGSPLTMAEEIEGVSGNDEQGYSFTWTFYKFATVKGYVTIKWYGWSNGYYSESVDFCSIKDEPNWEFTETWKSS